MSDFSTISSFYREKSLVQASAGKQLMELLAIPPDADILDVGCGAGNLTAELRELTSGRVAGIDPSEGMIRQSRELCSGKEIEFHVMAADELPFADEFDILFCSSVFQWFSQPSVVLERFHRALRPAGRVGIQAPATRSYCPNFLRAIEHCRRVPEIDALFAGFRPPWHFRETADDYRLLFEQAGFRVPFGRIVEERQEYTVDQSVDVFRSGAAAGYLNQDRFSAPLPADFSARLLQGIRESFAAEANAAGRVELLFHRIYLVAEKE